jgi:hypothetical protein
MQLCMPLLVLRDAHVNLESGRALPLSPCTDYLQFTQAHNLKIIYRTWCTVHCVQIP